MASGIVVAGDGSAGVVERVDFGCHFLRSGVCAGVAIAAVCVSVGEGGLSGAGSGMEDAADFGSGDGPADLGCHFFRSTDGVAVERVGVGVSIDAIPRMEAGVTTIGAGGAVGVG